jgi:hypothetical protein
MSTFKTLCLAIAVAVFLGGCTGARMKEVFAECNARAAAGEFQSNLDRANCLNDAENRRIRSSYPYPDLLNLKQAYRVELAKQIDSGAMTEDEAKLGAAREEVLLTNEVEKRLALQAVITRATAPPQISPTPLNCYATGADAGVIARCQP